MQFRLWRAAAFVSSLTHLLLLLLLFFLLPYGVLLLLLIIIIIVVVVMQVEPKKARLFLRSDNFLTTNDRKACDTLKVSEFCPE